MSVLTVVAVALVLVGLSDVRRWGVWVMALAGSAPAGVALVVGGLGVPTLFAVACVLLPVAFLATQTHVAGWRPFGSVRLLSLMVLLLAWSFIITLLAPFLFNGLPTVLPRPSPLALSAGNITTSNIAQLTYLAIGLAVAVFVAVLPRVDNRVLAVPLVLVVLLSTWRYLSLNFGIPFPEGVFDNAPRAVLIETAAGGAERFRGILTEPASLGYFCLVAIAWGLSALPRATNSGRALLLPILVAATFLGVISTSTTFIVAGLICLAIAAIMHSTVFLGSRLQLGQGVVLLGIIGAAVLVFAIPSLVSLVTATVGRKLSSSSYDDRSGADTSSWAQVGDTFGIGVGLGGNRASSLIPSMFDSIGAVGVVLLLALLGGAAYIGLRDDRLRPAMWVLVASIVTRCVSGPDLSDSSGLIWLSLGLLVRAPRVDGDEPSGTGEHRNYLRAVARWARGPYSSDRRSAG